MFFIKTNAPIILRIYDTKLNYQQKVYKNKTKLQTI